MPDRRSKAPGVLIRATLALMVAGLIQIPSAAGAADDRADLLRRMDQQADRFGAISRQIWEFAEVGYNENQSSERLKLELRSEGFEIQEDVAGIPTAFVASWGRGKPVIAILGEYDALPGLSQEDTPVEKARVAGGAGHGCGHNLFGAASAFAAVAVRHYLEEKKLPGTIRFYGCPAEEGGGGKIYMARAGAFSDCDVALAWHPGTRNQASLSSSLANITAKFRFYGKAAHAAGAPDQGRSALDAVMLMNLATELLREHVPALTRIHYIITQGGGAPNVVPGVAETFYYARHPDMAALDLIWARILKCAEAAALATETRMEMELINSVYNLLPNEALTALLDRNLKRVGGVRYSPEEQKFAEALRSTFPPEVMPSMGSQEEVETPRADLGSGSTDVADVSWVVPTAQFTTATFVPGTPGHSWQATAAAGGSIGRKGMVVAAKTLALSAVELLTMPAEVDSARRVFEKRIAGSVYRSRLPAGQKPPLNYRQN